MPAWLTLGVILAGPFIAAMTIAAIRGSRAWHILAAAVLGEVLGMAFLVAWSSHIARQIAVGTRTGAVVSLPPGTHFSQRLPAFLLLAAVAVTIGAVVLFARRLFPNHS